MKKNAALLLGLLSIQIAFAQQPVQKKEYYDWLETTVKRTWYELGDGTYHGMEKFYYESGKIAYTMNYVKGVVIETKSFYEDGLPLIEVHRNSEGKYDGVQMYHQYANGANFLKAKAKATAGMFTEFVSYNSSGEVQWSYSNDGKVKEYKEFEDKQLVTNIKFENGHVTGFIKDKVSFNNNEIQKLNETYVKGEFVDDKLHVINYESNWDTYRVKIYDNQCDIKDEFLTAHPLMGQMFEFKMQIVKKNGYDTEVTDNAHEWQYSHYYAKFNDINKLTNYLLEQYVWDGKAIQKENDKVKVESIYDKGKLVTEKEFGQNGQVIYDYKNNIKSWYNPNNTLKHQEIYNDNKKIICVKKYENGTIQYIDTLLTNIEINGTKYDELSRLQYFDSNGKIQKEEIGFSDKTLKFKVFDINGNITDSDELRAELSDFYRKGNEASNQAVSIYNEIKEKMAQNFCLDENGVLSTGPSGFQKAVAATASALDEPYYGTGNQSTPECYNKKIKSIYEAIQILYKDYICSISKFNQTITEKKLNESYHAESLGSVVEQISYYKERHKVYIDLLNLCSTFNSYIPKFQEIISSSNSDEMDKQLKKKTDLNEIKSIIGLK